MSGLGRLNDAPEDEAKAALLRCCGSARWAQAMVAARPFQSAQALFGEADRQWERTGPADWREAMSHHPRIGQRQSGEKPAATRDWSRQEQQGVHGASAELTDALAEGNRAYEEKFGFIFLVCATGRSAAELLGLLRARLRNDRDVELKVAAGEQAKITRIRLEKLLDE